MQNGSNFQKNDHGFQDSRQETPGKPPLKTEAGWMSVFDDLDSDIYVYVSDPLSHELLYANQAVKKAFGSDVLGKKCFKAFYGLDLPCSNCDISDLFTGTPHALKIRNFYNSKLGRWLQSFPKAIQWPDGRAVLYEMAVEIHDRNEAEAGIERRLLLEKILSDISSRSVLTEDISQFLKDCLKLMGTALDAGHAYLFHCHGETESMDCVTHWIRENEILKRNNLQNLPARAISQWILRLKAGEILNFADIEDIPDGPLKAELRIENIRSVLAFPLRVMNVFYGFILFDGTRSLRNWKTEDADIFRTVMQVIGKTIETHETRRALRQSQDRYRALVDDMPAMVCRFLPDGTLTFVNDLYCGYFNKNPSELIGANFFQFIPEKDRSGVREHYTGLNPDHPIVTYEHQATAPDGGIGWQEWTDRAVFNEQLQVVEYQSIGRDITAEKRADQEKESLQRQLTQAQKLEAIGTLAGGIAHDFNNILSSIIGYTEIAMARAKQPSVINPLEKVIQSSERARDLVQQILAFSRKSDQHMKPLHIQSVMQESLELLRASLPATLTIRQNIQSEPIVVRANATQMHQVLMNLLTNAAHAVGSHSGTIEVGIRQVDLTEADTASFPDLTPGTHVQISVRDTGCGMAPEIADKIFDPYFTTKGRGTGLGLSVVQAIVKAHRGMIRVESAPGKGSVFYVCLPCSNEETTGPGAVKDSKPPTGTERILFVDDESNLAEIAQSALEYLGYRVETCTDSGKALEMFQESPGGFDLVITDMTMPGMTGDVLASKILDAAPDIPIVLCTGYSDRITEQKALAMGIRKFFYKPISLENMARGVREVLDNRKFERERFHENPDT